MSLTTEWDQPELHRFNVLIDGVEVCQVHAINKAHAEYLSESKTEFQDAISGKKKYALQVRMAND
ncbi:hypothetical protein [Tumebacillus permanentifrigoris]|uniref:hypothetical protein n=1 Tax=Tumebacillus permanentifrigoris TaxID=378543 RepID=UPI000D6B36A9|nr:hypothetical protein [Tumebacillus permanentifrigoris]